MQSPSSATVEWSVVQDGAGSPITAGVAAVDEKLAAVMLAVVVALPGFE